MKFVFVSLFCFFLWVSSVGAAIEPLFSNGYGNTYITGQTYSISCPAPVQVVNASGVVTKYYWIGGSFNAQAAPWMYNPLQITSKSLGATYEVQPEGGILLSKSFSNSHTAYSADSRKASAIYLLLAGHNGNVTYNITVTFTDNTQAKFLATALDWTVNASVALGLYSYASNLCPVKTSATIYTSKPFFPPVGRYIHEQKFNLGVTKIIKSITFVKTGMIINNQEATISIFSISIATIDPPNFAPVATVSDWNVNIVRDDVYGTSCPSIAYTLNSVPYYWTLSPYPGSSAAPYGFSWSKFGVFQSKSIPRVFYNFPLLDPQSTLSSLKLGDDMALSHILAVEDCRNALQLAVLHVGQNGDASYTLKLTFSDSTTETFNGLAKDSLYSTTPAFGPVQMLTTCPIYSYGAYNEVTEQKYYVHEQIFTLTTPKKIVSAEFSLTSSGSPPSSLVVFALSIASWDDVCYPPYPTRSPSSVPSLTRTPSRSFSKSRTSPSRTRTRTRTRTKTRPLFRTSPSRSKSRVFRV